VFPEPNKPLNYNSNKDSQLISNTSTQQIAEQQPVMSVAQHLKLKTYC
jgi:hypothetical protein